MWHKLALISILLRDQPPFVSSSHNLNRIQAMKPSSGAQLTLTHGDQFAVITEVGATLRCYEVAGEPVIWGFDRDQVSQSGQGQVLAPWPNRLSNGYFRFQDLEGHAAIDDPVFPNAMHGLVRWLAWRIDDIQQASCQLSCILLAQPAYPFDLRLSISYKLGDSGLVVEAAAENIGYHDLPFAIGFHPYIYCGSGGVNSSILKVPSRTRLVLNERKLPVGSEDAIGTPYEKLLNGVEAIGSLKVDDCFTELELGPDGRWITIIERDTSKYSIVKVWADSVFSHIMCYTGDGMAPENERRYLAVEPMTAPPNALQTGVGIVILGQGETFVGHFGIDPFG